MMGTHSPANERVKRKYFSYLKEARRQSEATIDGVAKALSRFEGYTGHRDFKAFHVNQAIAFKRHLAQQSSQVTGQHLSKATLHGTLASLKKFFHWLAGEPGYKSKLQYSDSDYFNLSEKETRVATARRDKAFPTLEQVAHTLAMMPNATEIERRDRALLAFALATGARDSAIASMKLKHVDLVAGKVYQDAREVNTKNSKSITTFFFPVGDEILTIVVDWVHYLRRDKLWGNDDPLFPATDIALSNDRQFHAAGLKREQWRSAGPIREVFRKAFVSAGFPYFNPHSLRKTLVQLGERLCRTPEHFKAWSQNLGHEGVLTTFTSYGAVSTTRQGELIRSVVKDEASTADVPAILAALARQIATDPKLAADVRSSIGDSRR